MGKFMKLNLKSQNQKQRQKIIAKAKEKVIALHFKSLGIFNDNELEIRKIEKFLKIKS